MRKKIIAGNWKMNKTLDEVKSLLEGIISHVNKNDIKCTTILSPAFPFLAFAAEACKDSSVLIAAQDMSANEEGAYTAEVSPSMLTSIGVDAVILGHSERRQYHGENDTNIAKKVDLSLKHHLIPIYCNGETLEQRKSGNHLKTVEEQTKAALFHLSEEEIKKVIIAYEPVWAIGTGETASPEQAEEIHAHIRQVIASAYSTETAEEISILYGGSVKPANAKELFTKANIDGGLIGGASLKAADFNALLDTY